MTSLRRRSLGGKGEGTENSWKVTFGDSDL